jgi:hypothetical protein
MKPFVQTHFKETVFQLLDETFEGPPPTVASAFLNKSTGLFQTLDEITAEEPPAKPGLEELLSPLIPSTCDSMQVIITRSK